MQTERLTSAKKLEQNAERLAFRAGVSFILTALFCGLALGTLLAGRSDFALAFAVLTLGIFFMGVALSYEGTEQTQALERLRADNEDPIAKLYHDTK